MTAKNYLCTIIGMLGGAVAALFGEWDNALTTLMICMAMDYVSGLVVAGIFHKSNKTKTGCIESRAGWKGLCKKAMTLFIVSLSYRVDLLLGTAYIQDAVIIAFISNEIISVIENAGLMGLPIPKVVTNAIEILKEKSEDLIQTK